MKTEGMTVGDILVKKSAPFDGVFAGEKKVVMIPSRLLGGKESVQVDSCASPESGALSATVSARFGGGAMAAVMHYVDFRAEREGKAEIVAAMEYVGAVTMPWLGFFTGLKKVWEVNGAKEQERLETSMEWRTLSARCAELGLFNGGDRYDRLVDTVSAMGRITAANDVDKVLAMLRSRRIMVAFPFHAVAGENRIGVGLAAKASAGLASRAYAVVAGRITSLRIRGPVATAMPEPSAVSTPLVVAGPAPLAVPVAEAVVPAAPTPPAAQEIEAKYIGNTESRELHLAKCPSQKAMSDKHRKPFDTITEGKERGYRVCWRCIGRPKELQGRWFGGMLGLREAKDIERYAKR